MRTHGSANLPVHRVEQGEPVIHLFIDDVQNLLAFAPALRRD